MSVRHPINYGANQCLRSVSTKHGHVRDVEVAVLETVGIGESRTVPLDGPEWRVVIAADMPCHGHTIRHDTSASSLQFGGLRTSFAKSRIFAVFQFTHQAMINGRSRRVRHNV